MHNTNRIFPEEGFLFCNSANIVSVSIVSSDYGYPLNVYGTIIARDSLDRQRVYLFQRAKDDCQNISSKVILVLTPIGKFQQLFSSFTPSVIAT